jgi:hypothetical protein
MLLLVVSDLAARQEPTGTREQTRAAWSYTRRRTACRRRVTRLPSGIGAG